jgi:hypothetical protein
MHALRGAFVGSLLLSSSASAAGEDRPFRLKYDAPAECPGVDHVATRIRASTAHARPAVGDEPHHDMTVVVSRAETGFVAALAVRSPDGSETARTVPAPTCTEAVNAAALILAITIDPEAAAPESSKLEAEAKATPPAQAETPKNAERETSKPDTPAPKPPLPDPEFDRQAPKRFPDRLLVDAGVGFVALALSPGLSPDFFGGLAYEPGLRKAVPRFGLSVHYALSPAVEAPQGSASFERLGGRFDACPLRAGSRDLSLRPCLSFEAGRYLASGTGIQTSQDHSVFWAAGGAFLSGELRAPETWAARAEVGALFPFRRDEFYFDPGHRIVHTIPPVGVFFAVALELEIL